MNKNPNFSVKFIGGDRSVKAIGRMYNALTGLKAVGSISIVLGD